MLFAKYLYCAHDNMVDTSDLYEENIYAHTLPICAPETYTMYGIYMMCGGHICFWLHTVHHFVNVLERRETRKGSQLITTFYFEMWPRQIIVMRSLSLLPLQPWHHNWNWHDGVFSGIGQRRRGCQLTTTYSVLKCDLCTWLVWHCYHSWHHKPGIMASLTTLVSWHSCFCCLKWNRLSNYNCLSSFDVWPM